MSLLGDSNPFGKDVWLPGCYDQLENTPGLFWSQLSTTEPVRMEGRRTYFKVEIGDSLGQETLTDGGDFPNAIDPEYAEAQLDLSEIGHTAGLTFREWQLLNSDAAAAVPVVERKLFKAVQKMARDLARQCLMDGSAVLARAASEAGVVVTLENDDGSAGQTPANQYDRDRWNWLAPRRTRIDIVDPTTGAAVTNGSNRTIVSISKSADTVTLDAAGGTPDVNTGDVITWAGSVAKHSSGAYTSGEFPGINAILQKDRTYLGINSATAANDFWDPVVITGSTPGTNEPISLDRILTLYNEMALFADDGMQPANEMGHRLWSNFGVTAAAIELLAPAIRYAEPQSTDVAEFAWRRVQGLGIEWVNDIHYPHNVLDCLHEPSLHRVKPTQELMDIMDFLPGDFGQGVWRLRNAAVGQGHAAGANAYMYGTFGMMTYKPAAHGRLTDIEELGVS